MKKTLSMALALLLTVVLTAASFGTPQEDLASVRKAFDKTFSNELIVLSTSDKIAVGASSRVKITRSWGNLNTKTLHFYNYNKSKNKTTTNKTANYTIDEKGTLSFTIDSNQGYVVITDSPLVKGTKPATSKTPATIVIPLNNKTPNQPAKQPAKTVEKEYRDVEENSSWNNQSSHTEQSSRDISNYSSEVFRLINIERVKAGLDEVSWNDDFSTGADIRAEELTRHFGHTRPEPPVDTSKSWPKNVSGGGSYNAPSVADELGISYDWIMENAGYGQRSPQDIVSSWMKSSGHRANILTEDHTECAVGVYEKNGTLYWILWLD